MLIKNNKTDNNERRNYYRILNVQPDAPIEIIRNNYRTLLQKLRLHPDLGGKNWNASIINEAYNVLRNPEKRAAYDLSLLQRYKIHSLSRGHLVKSASRPRLNTTIHKKDRHGNQRNFYRLFNIQPDSPVNIIKTSYLSLSKNSSIPKELLNEAYSILGNVDKRKLYDRLLNQYCHADAIGKLMTGSRYNLSKPKPSSIALLSARASHGHTSTSNLKAKYNGNNKNYYQPVITQYCFFCKTPHNQSPCKHTTAICHECYSPLSPPSPTFLEQQRREVVRLSQRSLIQFYLFWPGKKLTGKIADISPTGMQLLSSIKLNKNQTIKLDGDDFKAVGIVSYNRSDYEDNEFETYTSGIKFLAVNFDKLKGQFFSASA